MTADYEAIDLTPFVNADDDRGSHGKYLIRPFAQAREAVEQRLLSGWNDP